MKMAMSKEKAPLYAGIGLTILGLLLLLWTHQYLTEIVRFWPAIMTGLGVFFLFKAFFRQARPAILLCGLLLTLTGVFILLLNTLLTDVLTLRELWPVFMGIVGFSLVPYSAKFRRTIRISLLIPALFLIVLMGLFLLFSLSIVKQSLPQLVLSWWPLIIVFMGMTLVISYYVRTNEAEKDTKE